MADIMCSKFFFRQGLLFKLKKKAEKGKVVPFRRANLASSNMILLKDSNKVFYKKRRPRLLFATGNQFLRSHFSDCFPAKDALCFFAQDTLDVASVLENHLLDFVIIDAALPFGSGLEVCRLIKSHKNFQKIPVLLFSQKKFPFSFIVCMTHFMTF